MEAVIFGSESVRAILAGTKTVTRRTSNVWGRRAIGSVLRVKETWKAFERPDGHDGIVYAADGHFQGIANTPTAADLWVALNDNGRHGAGWRPAMYMPRVVGRLQIRLVSVEQQPLSRLAEMGEAEARREGAESVDAYYAGWRELNRTIPRGVDPDVWRIEFEVIGPAYTGPLFELPGPAQWAHLYDRSVRIDGLIVVRNAAGRWNIQRPDGTYWVTEGQRPRRQWFQSREMALSRVELREQGVAGA